MYCTTRAGPLEKIIVGILAMLAYRRKGYGFKRFLVFFSSRVITFVTTKDGKRAGTISLILDGPKGLDLEEIYPDEIASMRSRGSIAEVGFLACFAKGQKKFCDIKLLQSLYGGIFRHAASQGVEILCIAVNPDHRDFYTDLLLFEKLGETKDYKKVKAKADASFLDLREWWPRIKEKKAKFAEKVYRQVYA